MEFHAFSRGTLVVKQISLQIISLYKCIKLIFFSCLLEKSFFSLPIHVCTASPPIILLVDQLKKIVYCRIHGGLISRWPHQKTSTLDDVIARNGT